MKELTRAGDSCCAEWNSIRPRRRLALRRLRDAPSRYPPQARRTCRHENHHLPPRHARRRLQPGAVAAEIWDEDVRLMQEAHVNVATLPVFGWVSLQPDEDTFTSSGWTRVMDKLHGGRHPRLPGDGHGFGAGLAGPEVPGRAARRGGRAIGASTATGTPSARIRPTSADCRSGLARKLAERYGNHPALEIWHVGNEYGSTATATSAPRRSATGCRRATARLEEVNERWYTTFWGHTYTDWSQIETPTRNGERTMQALLIDYDRFQSDSILELLRGRSRGSARDHARHSHHDESDGGVQAARLSQLGAGDGHRLVGLLPAARTRRRRRSPSSIR